MILDDYKDFLDSALNEIKLLDVDVSELTLDHIAYQCSSSEDYDSIMPKMLDLANLEKESIVGGRRVGIFKLKKELQYKQYKIDAIELIEPKKNQICESSLGHLEFVFNSFDNFLKLYPDIEWDLKALNRKEYPKIQITLANGTELKFHDKHILEEL